MISKVNTHVGTRLWAHTEHVMKVIRINNGNEYLSKAFDVFLSKHDIAWQTSSPYTPQQNGVMEQTNHTIIEMAQFMIHAQRLGYEFWAKAMCNAMYMRNRCQTKDMGDETPKEAWARTMQHLFHVFGM